MIKKYANITQSEYNDLAEKYFAIIGHKTLEEERKSFEFFAQIFKRLEYVLKKKFSKIGYTISRIPSDSTSKQTKVYYKAVSQKDAFGFSLLPQSLNFTHLMEDVRMINPQHSKEVPDVKIADPEYLEEKIQEISNQAFQRFLTLSNQTTESNQYVQTTRNAPEGNRPEAGSNQNQTSLL